MVKDTLGSDIILRSLAHRSIAELQNGLIEEREIIPPNYKILWFTLCQHDVK